MRIGESEIRRRRMMTVDPVDFFELIMAMIFYAKLTGQIDWSWSWVGTIILFDRLARVIASFEIVSKKSKPLGPQR